MNKYYTYYAMFTRHEKITKPRDTYQMYLIYYTHLLIK